MLAKVNVPVGPWLLASSRPLMSSFDCCQRITPTPVVGCRTSHSTNTTFRARPIRAAGSSSRHNTSETNTTGSTAALAQRAWTATPTAVAIMATAINSQITATTRMPTSPTSTRPASSVTLRGATYPTRCATPCAARRAESAYRT